MRKPLKILSAIDIPWNSALAAYAFDQAQALRAAGHEVIFACPAGSAAAAFAATQGFRSVAIPGRKEYLGLPGAVLRLRRLAAAEHIDLFCAHTGRVQTLGWAAGLPLLRVKADVKKPSAGFVSRAARRVIAASAYIKELYDAAGAPCPVEVIRQGIVPPPSSPARAAAPLRVGILGRLDPVKGHACFLKAAAQLLAAGAEAEFHIAGAEANITCGELKALAEQLGIEDRVFFHGRVAATFAFMQSCDIGVIASLGSEAVSRAALEWLACGRPLAAAAVGSLPEYLPADRLFPAGDSAALAALLSRLLADPAAAAAEGAANRARAERDFSSAAFAAATVKLFESAAGEAR